MAAMMAPAPRPPSRVAGAGMDAPPGRVGMAAGARRIGLGIHHPLCERALAIWPGLDHTQLTRTHGDPRKVARLVARRTIHSEETILTLLQGG